MEPRKIGGVTVRFIVAFFVLATFATAVHAQAILKGKGVFAQGICHFNKDGQMVKGGETPKPCLLASDGTPDKSWAIILDEKGSAAEVIEMDLAKRVNKRVWAKGRVDT